MRSRPQPNRDTNIPKIYILLSLFWLPCFKTFGTLFFVSFFFKRYGSCQKISAVCIPHSVFDKSFLGDWMVFQNQAARWFISMVFSSSPGFFTLTSSRWDFQGPPRTWDPLGPILISYHSYVRIPERHGNSMGSSP